MTETIAEARWRVLRFIGAVSIIMVAAYFVGILLTFPGLFPKVRDYSMLHPEFLLMAGVLAVLVIQTILTALMYLIFRRLK